MENSNINNIFITIFLNIDALDKSNKIFPIANNIIKIIGDHPAVCLIFKPRLKKADNDNHSTRYFNRYNPETRYFLSEFIFF